jgi:hypothetical protein
MTTSPACRLFTAAVLIAIGTLTGPALAQVSGADIPKDSYHDNPLTPAERNAIAEEENVSPNDGRPSVPDAADRGVIPDAVEDGGAATPAEKPGHRKTAESEADVILDESKKNARVTAKDLSECEKQWDPQTQMSKQEWAESCRTTLEYFPEEKK